MQPYSKTADDTVMNNPHLAPLGLSVPAASRFRRVTVLTVGILAFFAAILSFAGLRALALEAGIPVQLAWIFPILIDGLVLTGSLGVIASTLTGISTAYPWFITLLGVAASVIGNVASAPDDLLSRAVHAAPPIVFALSIEGLLRVYRVGAAALVVQVQHEQEEHEKEEHEKEEHERYNVPLVSTTTKRDEISVNTEKPAATFSPAVEGTIVSSETKVDTSPIQDSVNKNSPTARERILQLLEEDPDITGAEAARRLNIDPSHARKILRSIRESAQGTSISGEHETFEELEETESDVFETNDQDFRKEAVDEQLEENPLSDVAKSNPIISNG